MIAIAARMHRSQESHPATCTAVRPSSSRAFLQGSASVTSVKCIFGVKKKRSLPKNVLNLSLEKGPNAAIPHVSPEKHFREFRSNSFADSSWCRNKMLCVLGHSPKAPLWDYSVSYRVSSCAALIISQAMETDRHPFGEPTWQHVPLGNYRREGWLAVKRSPSNTFMAKGHTRQEQIQVLIPLCIIVTADCFCICTGFYQLFWKHFATTEVSHVGHLGQAVSSLISLVWDWGTAVKWFPHGQTGQQNSRSASVPYSENMEMFSVAARRGYLIGNKLNRKIIRRALSSEDLWAARDAHYC